MSAGPVADLPTEALSPTPTQLAAADGGRRRVVVRGGLWTAASQLLPSVGVALLSVVAARLLGPAALGRQSLIAYVNSALAAVVVAGLSGAALRELGVLQGRDDVRGAERLGAWVVRAHAAAGGVLFVVLALTGLAVGQDRLAWLAIGLVTVVDAVVAGMSVRVAVRDGWSQVGRLQLLAQLIGPPLGIGGVLLGLGIAGIFAGDGLAALGLLLLMLVRFGGTFPRSGGVPLRPPVPIGRSWLLFAAGGLVDQVVGRRVEFVVLALVSTDRQIATYSIAFMLVSLMAQAPSSVAVAALPVVAAAEARGEQERAAHHLRLSLRVGSLLSIPLAGLVAVVGPPGVLLVYGTRYAAASRLVPLAGLVLLVAVVAGVCAQYWSGVGQMRIVLLAGLLGGVVDIGVAFGLAPAFGATGAVAANLAGQTTAVVTLLLVTRRRLGAIGWSVRSLLAMGASTLLAAGAGVATVRAVRGAAVGLGSVNAALLELVAAMAVWAVVFTLAAARLRVLAPAEAEWLAPLLPARLVRLMRAVAW